MADINRGRLVLDVRSIPEVVFEVRKALANTLRDYAEAEADPRVAERLRQIAADFEAGQG